MIFNKTWKNELNYERCFYIQLGTENKLWVPTEKWRLDGQILGFDALPLSFSEIVQWAGS